MRSRVVCSESVFRWPPSHEPGRVQVREIAARSSFDGWCSPGFRAVCVGGGRSLRRQIPLTRCDCHHETPQSESNNARGVQRRVRGGASREGSGRRRRQGGARRERASTHPSSPQGLYPATPALVGCLPRPRVDNFWPGTVHVILPVLGRDPDPRIDPWTWGFDAHTDQVRTSPGSDQRPGR